MYNQTDLNHSADHQVGSCTAFILAPPVGVCDDLIMADVIMSQPTHSESLASRHPSPMAVADTIVHVVRPCFHSPSSLLYTDNILCENC